MTNKFDKSKATLGVHGRTQYYSPDRGGYQEDDALKIASDEMDKYIESQRDSVEDYATAHYAAMRVGISKGASVAEGGDHAPDNIEWPLFPDPGGASTQGVDRLGSTNLDLDAHGSHEAPKPSAKQLIKERLRNMGKQVQNKEKKIVTNAADAQQRAFEDYQSSPVDLIVDRREIDITRSNSQMDKIGGSLLMLLEEEDANPIKIMLVLDQMWDEDWRGWEPETIIQTLKMDGVDAAKINLDKIMALKVLLNTQEFWKDARTFEKVCLSFAGRIVDWGNVQEPRVHEMSACVALIERYVEEREFSDDVAAYVAGSAVRDGYILLPSSLSFANFPFSSELSMSMGDGVMEAQNDLISAIRDEGAESLEDHEIQYRRLLRCQYHTQDMVDGARA